jgi:cysteine desulfurase
MKRIYLDNNATTFVASSVIDAVVHVHQNYPGNPSSPHQFGRDSKKLLLKSRETIASFLKVRPKEIIFNSGATEGANLILRGILSLTKGHVLTSDVEHACVHSTLKALTDEGTVNTTFLPAGLKGFVSKEQILEAIRPDTKLIALMAVNNETGVKTPIEEIAQIAEEKKILFFVDGVALFGKELFTIPSGVSAMIFSGHKFHAPKGCGFMYLKSTLKLLPQITGGEQEYNRRGGTENLADIAAMAEATRLLNDELPLVSKNMLELRQHLEESLKKEFKDLIIINGEGERICNTVNIAFRGMDGETLLAALDMQGIAASHGSACASGALEPSRILLNMGLSLEEARSSIRFSLSRFTTKEEIDRTLDVLHQLIPKMKPKN